MSQPKAPKAPDLSRLSDHNRAWIKQNISIGAAIRALQDRELRSLLSEAIVPIDTITPSEGIALFIYCMDERCSTLDQASSAHLARIPVNDLRSGRWQILKARVPPFFAGKDRNEEMARAQMIGERIAERIVQLKQHNPRLDIRVIATVHEGCGGAQALFDREYYLASSMEQAVRQHLHTVQRYMERGMHDGYKPSFEITPLPLHSMRPSIGMHYADMALVTMLPQSTTLRMSPLITSGRFPRTYQISGHYLLSDPRAVGQIAALSAHISTGTHALPRLITPDRPFQYILLGDHTTEPALQTVRQELHTSLSTLPPPLFTSRIVIV